MKQNLKKLLILLLIASLLPLYGCGGASVDNTVPMGRYVEEAFDLPEGVTGILARAVGEDGSLNIYTMEEMRNIAHYTTKDGESWEKQATEWKIPENEVIMNMAVGSGGEIYIATMEITQGPQITQGQQGRETTQGQQGPQGSQTQGVRVQGGGPAQGSGPSSGGGPVRLGGGGGSRLNIYQAEGSALLKIDVNWVTGSGPMPGMVILSDMKILPNGDLLAGQYGAGVAQYGQDGSHKRTYGNPQVEAFTVSGNKIYIIDSGSSSILVYDTETFDNIGSLAFDSLNMQTSIATGENGAVYLYNSNGVFRLLPDGTLFEKIIDGDMTSLSLPNNFPQGFLEARDGAFYMFSFEEQAAKLLRYTYNANIAARPANELVVFTLYDNRTLRQAAGLFMKANPDTRINIQVGMGEDGATVSEIVRTLNTEIMAGKGPDIIMLDGLNADNYIDKGVLLDITGLINEVAGKEKFIENVIKAFERDGKVYAVPAKFSMPAIFLDAENAAAAKDISSLADFAEANGDKGIVGNKNAENLFRIFQPGSMPGWLSGKEIDEVKLAEYLKAVKRMADTDAEAILPPERRGAGDNIMIRRGGPAYEVGESNFEDVFSFAFKRIHSYVSRMSSFRALMMPIAAAEYRGEWAALPLPGLVDSVFIPSAIAGINAKSGKTDIAVEFIKTMLSRDIQSVKLSDGFAVNIEALKDTMETEGNLMVGFMMSGIGFEGETIQAGTPGIEEQEKILDLCLAVRTPYLVDNMLAEMVAGEAKGYFAGEKDLEKTIADIKERTRIYLSE